MSKHLRSHLLVSASVAAVLCAVGPVQAETIVPPVRTPAEDTVAAAQVAQATTPAQPASEGAEEEKAPPPDSMETMVVTGFRRSLLDSIQAKRTADSIVEAISSEDIGKLPDNSIAEALSRLPGIATQRVDGRAQTIAARGLAADFTTTLLNGREQVSSDDNRSVQFDQYPSELISQALVYKTPTASLIPQGLAATVDLRTIKPIQYNERVLAVQARGEYNTNGRLNPDSPVLGYRASGYYVDQFLDNTVGISVGVSRLDQPTQTNFIRPWGYPTTEAGDFIIGGAEMRANSSNLERTAVAATLQWAPSESLESTVDFYYTDYEDTQFQRGIELPLFWGGGGRAEPHSS